MKKKITVAMAMIIIGFVLCSAVAAYTPMLIIRECPHCRAHVVQEETVSGNTIGATYWTDGKREAKMLPDHPWLAKCPMCNFLFWIDEAVEVDTGFDAAKGKQQILKPTEKELLGFLTGPALPADKELYMRVSAWRSANDAWRWNLRGDEIDSVVLKEVLELVFSRHNLEKYSEMIADSVTDEKKELEALVSRYAKEKEALNKKKAVYFEGLESGKLDTALVGERLRQLKEEEETVSIKYLEADERLSSLAMPEQRRLTVKDYEELKQSLKSFVEESTASQKKAFLSRFIKSVTVHPDKLTVEYHPPYFTNKKSPNLEGEGFSVIGVASPRGFEPLLPT